MGKSKAIINLLLFPLVCLLILNFLLVFTPEIGFDALWYHLTLPKLWLLKHQWYFPGGLLYYSVMPRLVETIYIPLLALFGTAGPKLLQYLAGLGTCLVIWKILLFLKQSLLTRMLAISLFYATWLVSWQSGSAYLDLIRTFLESLALFFLLRGSWWKGGLILGLAIGTKWLALGSLFIYSLIFGPSIVFPALLLALPWFWLAFHFTGNPLYPIFSGVIHNSFASFSSQFKHLIFSPFYLTKPFDDFLSPLIGLIFILTFFQLKSKSKPIRQIALVAILGTFFSLVLDPPSSRFVLPFLPALAISGAIFISSIQSIKVRTLAIFLVISSGFFILSLRLWAIKKYLPFLTGQVDQKTFLIQQSSRLPGTFIDSDGYVENLPASAKILVNKLHNLYYFPRNFDHTSWVTDYSNYDFLVTIGEDPASFSGVLVHTNNLGIQIFKLK